MRILCLDDEPALLQLTTHLLEQLGHTVAAFSDAAQALALFRESPQKFDLVLTDMSMPGASGLEFAQQVIGIAPNATVVISTGCVDPNWANHARELGVSDVIEKPFTLDAMSKVMSRLPGRSLRNVKPNTHFCG